MAGLSQENGLGKKLWFGRPILDEKLMVQPDRFW